MKSIIRKTPANVLYSLVILLSATLFIAGGPLSLHSPGVPFVWGLGTFTTLPGGVPYLKDMGDLNAVLVPKVDADALTDLSMTEISAVATSIMTLTAAGDIAMDITGANVGAYLSTFHGAGIDVIYDEDGSVMAALGVPGALGLGGITFTDAVTPEIAAGFGIMNGPAIDAGDVGGTFFRIVFTQEVAHALNLHHDQTNGAISFFGDNTAPGGTLAAPDCPSLPGVPAFADFTALYPFADISFGGPGAEAASFDHLEDLSSLSRLYPTGTYATTTGTITGTVFASDGVTPVNGVNVIARSTVDPFSDTRSAITGDLEFTPGDGFAGGFILTGLTPGVDYTLAIDNQVAGAFPQPPPAPFIEEFWNGGLESSDPVTDDPCALTTIPTGAGVTSVADIILNSMDEIIVLGDDDFAEVDLPFAFPFCGTDYTSVFVGSNGYLTFGVGVVDFPSVFDLLSGPPRIAGMWDDLDPAAGGTVTVEEIAGDFVITFDAVPEFGTANDNTFAYTLRSDGTYNVDYPNIDALDGLAGRSEGGGATDPGETDLSAASQPIGVGLENVYELFDAADNDLSGDNLEFDLCPAPIPPDIDVSPTSFVFNLPVGGTDFDTLTISNTAPPGSGDLNWFFTEEDVTPILENGGTLPVRFQKRTHGVRRTPDFTYSSPRRSSSPGQGGVVSKSDGILFPVIKTDPLTFFTSFNLKGGYVAKGAGLRGTGSGSITISAIPGGSNVVAAYLYWSTVDNATPTPGTEQGVFNGTNINGVLIGMDLSPCWSPPNSYVYWADVTSLVSGNDTYTLSGFLDSGDFNVAPFM